MSSHPFIMANTVCPLYNICSSETSFYACTTICKYPVFAIYLLSFFSPVHLISPERRSTVQGELRNGSPIPCSSAFPFPTSSMSTPKLQTLISLSYRRRRILPHQVPQPREPIPLLSINGRHSITISFPLFVAYHHPWTISIRRSSRSSTSARRHI